MSRTTALPLDFLQDLLKDNLDCCCISQELHQDGNQHLHAFCAIEREDPLEQRAVLILLRLKLRRPLLSGTLVLMNGLQPGTGASQRIGKKAVFKNYLLRAAIGVPTNAGAIPLSGYVRLMIVMDKQTNATAPTVAQILETVAAISPMNMDNRDRFTVLHDYQCPVDQLGGRPSTVHKKFRKNQRNHGI